MKDKKGIVLGIVPIIYMVLVVIILILLVWFGFRINEGLTSIFTFLKEWWWAIALSVTGILFHAELRAIFRWILSKFGIKV